MKITRETIKNIIPHIKFHTGNTSIYIDEESTVISLKEAGYIQETPLEELVSDYVLMITACEDKVFVEKNKLYLAGLKQLKELMGK